MMYYEKADPPSGGGNGGNEWDGKVVIKYKDEENVFDLSNPEERQRLTDLAQKGFGADKTWQQVAEMRRYVEEWEKLLESARSDDAALEDLKSRIEQYIGRPLTKQEKKELEEEAFAVDPADKLLKTIEELNQKVSTLEEKIKKSDIDRLADVIDRTNEKLANKYNAKDDWPKYNKEKVLEYAGQHNLLISGDIEEGLETAYKMLHLDELTARARKETLEKVKENQERIQKAQVEKDGDAGTLPPPEKKFKRWGEITEHLLKEVPEDKLFSKD